MRFRFPLPLYEAPDANPGGGDPPAKPVMPEGLPADFWDADKGEVKFGDLGTKFGELSTFKAARDAELAEVPAKPDDYKLELPADFKMPEGLEFKLDDKDPAFAAVRTFAHENKLPQKTVSALLAIEAQRQAADLQRSVDYVLGEEKALGANFPERKAAVEAFLRTNLSETHYEGLRTRIDAGGAKAFEAVEKLVELATAGGIPDSGNRGGGDAPKLLKDILYPQKAS